MQYLRSAAEECMGRAEVCIMVWFPPPHGEHACATPVVALRGLGWWCIQSPLRCRVLATTVVVAVVAARGVHHTPWRHHAVAVLVHAWPPGVTDDDNVASWRGDKLALEWSRVVQEVGDTRDLLHSLAWVNGTRLAAFAALMAAQAGGCAVQPCPAGCM
eukprot:m.202038 g.202038  ORF g.202038 m.202038 type:complete len:159 (+) comp21664_c0_seq1:1161-1637(+)